jgi:hypothetical protein
MGAEIDPDGWVLNTRHPAAPILKHDSPYVTVEMPSRDKSKLLKNKLITGLPTL